MADIEALRAAVRDAGIDGWLLYDFRRSNPIAHRALGLPEEAFFSRRWAYYVPANGEPTALVSAVEPHVLAGLPGRQVVYRTWQQYEGTLRDLVSGARRVAMEYVPRNEIPYVSRVDAGTVDLIRSFGPEVITSADFAQRFEAVLSADQIESHRVAGKALLRARDVLFRWLRDQLQSDAALSEYDVASEFARLIRAEGLAMPVGELPHAAVNANAGNPHYAATSAQSAPVRRGDLLLLDFWGKLPGPESIFADYTWMAMAGERVPEHIATLFGIIREARDVGISLLRERFETGTRVEGAEVDDAVRAVITQAGYGDSFVHRTGHNIGTMVHGNGAHLDNLETHDTRPLLANTCTSMEPGIYLPQQGLGLRTEVDVLLLPGGIEVTGVPVQTEVTPLLG
jgi:Xaa-Pro aminopeptidase